MFPDLLGIMEHFRVDLLEEFKTDLRDGSRRRLSAEHCATQERMRPRLQSSATIQSPPCVDS
jgi:hypothetical protein